MNKPQRKIITLAFKANNRQVNEYNQTQKAVFLKVEAAELFNELKIKPWHTMDQTTERNKESILSEIADILIFTAVSGTTLPVMIKFLSEEIETLATLDTYFELLFETRKDAVKALYVRALKLVRSIIDYSGSGAWNISLDDVLHAFLDKTNENADRFDYPQISITTG